MRYYFSSSLSPPVEVAHQFQYAVRVIGSNYAPTIERDEFLVSEKIKKECECRRSKDNVAQRLLSKVDLPPFLAAVKHSCVSWNRPSIVVIVDSDLHIQFPAT